MITAFAQHDEKLYFLPSCSYRIILIGDFDEFLQKVEAFCVTYQHVSCLYKLFKYRFSGEKFAQSEQVFDNVKKYQST